MSKQKTRKSILKRFKLSANRKVFRARQYSRHRRAHKSRRRIRTFAQMVELKGRQAKVIKQLI